jgi:hypothetical protein
MNGKEFSSTLKLYNEFNGWKWKVIDFANYLEVKLKEGKQNVKEFFVLKS